MSIDPGGVVDKRYEVYCLVDSYFYDSTSQLGEQPRDFELAHAPLPEGWAASELEDWCVHSPVGVELPAQGWKVHVSACLDNAERVLAAVAAYCRNRRIAFKFRRSPDALLLANAKYADRGSSGKFVTIYPVDVAQLEDVLTELGEVLDGSPGRRASRKGAGRPSPLRASPRRGTARASTSTGTPWPACACSCSSR